MGHSRNRWSFLYSWQWGHVPQIGRVGLSSRKKKVKASNFGGSSFLLKSLRQLILKTHSSVRCPLVRRMVCRWSWCLKNVLEEVGGIASGYPQELWWILYIAHAGLGLGWWRACSVVGQVRVRLWLWLWRGRKGPCVFFSHDAGTGVLAHPSTHKTEIN